jgi:hypothetical protein
MKKKAFMTKGFFGNFYQNPRQVLCSMLIITIEIFQIRLLNFKVIAFYKFTSILR